MVLIDPSINWWAVSYVSLTLVFFIGYYVITAPPMVRSGEDVFAVNLFSKPQAGGPLLRQSPSVYHIPQ